MDHYKMLFLDYLVHEKRYSPHTMTSYKNDIDCFMKYVQLYGIQDVAHITEGIIRDWLIHLKEQDYTAKSIHRKRSAVLSFFKFLLYKEYITAMPFQNIAVPKIHKILPVFATQKEMKNLFTHITFANDFEGKTHRMILLFFYYMGVRVSELANIKRTDIDWANQQIKIAQGKGGKTRIIPITSDMIEELKIYAQERQQFFQQEPLLDNYFLSKKGKSLNSSTIYLIVKRYLSQATTLDKCSPHVLRHTFATHLLEQGADINAIKELLGHSSLAATQVYTHLNIKKLKDTYKKAHPKS